MRLPATQWLIKRTRTLQEHVDEEGQRLLRETYREDVRLRDGGEGLDKVVTQFAPAYYRCGCPFAYHSYCPVHEYVGSAPWSVAVRWWKGRRHVPAPSPSNGARR